MSLVLSRSPRRAPVTGSRLVRAAAGAVVLLVLLPLLALGWTALQGSGDLWPHLIANVIPHALLETSLLVLGVGAFVAIIGTGTAWLVAVCRFPGRGVFEWALLLPLAIPTYIQAFVYVDAVHPLGPIPTLIRTSFGLRPRDLWLPEVRSLPGCIILLGLVLYPYVYLSARAAFLVQTASVLDAARTLGAGAGEAFFRIALPLARPAIAVGVTLALMETVNDIGASEFLGVQTLTLSIYSTWLNRSSLPGAAQIALCMLLLMFALVMLERWGRRHQKTGNIGDRARPPVRRSLSVGAAALAFIACLIPVVLGFVLPAGHLALTAWKRVSFHGVSQTILTETANTALFAALGTVLALLLGFAVVVALRTGALRSGLALRLASLGYAVPGTVLAVGLLVPLASFDNLVSGLSERLVGVSTGLLLSGSGAALIIAYVIRFLAIPIGGLEAGYGKVGTTLDMAARSLGERPGGVVRLIHLPMLRPALGGAALLVFVDCMKELPATLMLRPLNFETLASHVYAEAARGTYEDGALAALLIVLVGLVPVILLARLSRPRQG
ncbi:iron(III) transport system permease protein [Ancylobacter aquaticus]|uniref:Iron(III) transport system permease protein n=1 Tax=Ancylobacter aquaticus TaxID=100 RepID=A0A4R1IA72_ANCAQ|nr:iron ABC transporter permease [Ancylobacter aquaticus]TCK31191.1 iron(III) transport system permease protein [Ancylobacter aquaticus]